MRIDIHTHTKKVKEGDSPNRNINVQQFTEIIKNTDVKILAITNHNHFDLQQYNSFRGAVDGTCQIWPGIELDILENNKRAHLLVIANPKDSPLFDACVSSILKNKDPDTFSINLQDTVNAFKSIDCIYIAHYFVKKPNLGDEEIERLSGLLSNPKRILKEATNSISAGIYISHGHNSIYGSDVQDWAQYIQNSKDLPELRLPVESFEQFCLLLEKDEATINTLLNKKVKENIEVSLFSAAEMVRLDIYNDINILFGSKGTGKTKILDELSRYFNSRGHKTSVYKSNDHHVNDIFDLRGITIDANVSEFGIDDCEEEINLLKTATEGEITSITKYYHHFAIAETNKISQKLKIKNVSEVSTAESIRHLEEVITLSKQFNSFKNILVENDDALQAIDGDLLSELTTVLDRFINKIATTTEDRFFDAQSILFLNNIVSTFIKEISKKTGQPPKPINTGFFNYAINRIKIELAAKKILLNVGKEIKPIIAYAGSLGVKGELYCQTNLKLQNGTVTNSSFKPVKSIPKRPLKDFITKVGSIKNHIFSNELFEKIAELNDIDNIEQINNLSCLLLKYRHFTLNDNEYEPSNGESSMILLHKELKEDKDIYLIDEPEKSLGNDYISEVIVPLLKEKALLAKKVIVATHDANIAVRTLPYNSIYRLHEDSQYFTMTGNPFSNTLKCINNNRPDLGWKEISMKTLEGGKEAFGERNKIYGN